MIHLPGSAEGIEGGAEERLELRAREDPIGAWAGVGGDEGEETAEIGETVRGGEGGRHPEEGVVVVAEGVEGGGPVEDGEVVVGEERVVAEGGAEESG